MVARPAASPCLLPPDPRPYIEVPMSSRVRPVPIGFIAPCLPSKVAQPPAGDGWMHEIKYDGFRLQAWRQGDRVRLFTRRGLDWTKKFPDVARGIAALPCRSCLIDGEVVACDEAGVPHFNLLRHGAPASLYAFDLLELDGREVRREPIEARKASLARLIGADRAGLLLSQPIDADAAEAFAHICKLGLEGIVSKRRGTAYESGRSDRWVKTINPNAPAVVRLLEEEWNG